MKSIVEIYKYRHLLTSLISSELKLRYRRSTLGFLWTLLNPLLMMTVLTVVFSSVMRFNTRDYALLLLSGLLPWTFISQSVAGSLMSIVGKGNLIKKVYIPKSIIPLATVLANLVNFVLSLVPLLAIGAFLGHGFSPALVFLPISVCIVGLFACGLALLFSCLNVFFRDFTHMTEVLLQALFYASPIIYTRDMIPEKYAPLFVWNPIVYIIECFRAPIYKGELPSMDAIAVATTGAFAVCALGLVVFLANEERFVLRV